MDSATFNSPRPAHEGVRTLRHKLTKERRARAASHPYARQRMVMMAAVFFVCGAAVVDLALMPHPMVLDAFGLDSGSSVGRPASALPTVVAPNLPPPDQKLTINSMVSPPPQLAGTAANGSSVRDLPPDPIITGVVDAVPLTKPLVSTGTIRNAIAAPKEATNTTANNAKTQQVRPDQLCDLLKTSGLSSARWQQDSLDHNLWSCLTDVEHVGAAGLFASIRGPNPQTLGMVRIKMNLTSGPDDAAARQKAKTLIENISRGLGLVLPPEAMAAMSAFKEYVYTSDEYQFSFRPQLDDPNRVNIFVRPLHVRTVASKAVK